MALFKKADKTPAKSATEWPPINELVWLRLPCCDSAIHPSRVEGIEGNSLIVAEPTKPHLEAAPTPAESRPLMLGWREGVSSKQVRVKLVAQTPGEVPTWTFEAMEPAVLIQRRRFVRAEWDHEITFYFPMDTVEGKIVDLSEGGLRCRIPVMSEPRSPYFRVSFTLDEEPLLLDVEVAWWGEPIGDTVLVGLQFVDHSPALSDRLRAFAFNQQLEQRRNKTN